MSSELEQLKAMSVVVADTGDFRLIDQYKPCDSTTNPSLILQVVNEPTYKGLFDDAVAYAKSNGSDLGVALDKLYVNFGLEILKVIPGRVSVEVDARLSYEIDAQVQKALGIIKMFENAGISKERILIKISSTYEGIKAAEILERDHGVHCNLTLLFSLTQAILCAQSKVTLISPFVGRILDWFVANTDKKSYEPFDDPGVKSVTEIYQYFKTFGHKTEVMAASFRNLGEIRALAGCDLLTIAPKFLKELGNNQQELKRVLSPENSPKYEGNEIKLDEKSFREGLASNEMASFKLKEGIEKFSADCIKVENMLKEKLA